MAYRVEIHMIFEVSGDLEEQISSAAEAKDYVEARFDPPANNHLLKMTEFSCFAGETFSKRLKEEEK